MRFSVVALFLAVGSAAVNPIAKWNRLFYCVLPPSFSGGGCTPDILGTIVAHCLHLNGTTDLDCVARTMILEAARDGIKDSCCNCIRKNLPEIGAGTFPCGPLPM